MYSTVDKINQQSSVVPENETSQLNSKLSHVEEEGEHSSVVRVIPENEATLLKGHCSPPAKSPRKDEENSFMLAKSLQDVEQPPTVAESQVEVERSSLLTTSSQVDEHSSPLTKSPIEEVEHSSHSEKSSKDKSISPCVMCSCNNSLPDPLMLRCIYCTKVQHAACYRILDVEKIPATHCCIQCSQEGEGRVCTDTKLVTMAAKQDVSSTCLLRRILAFLTVKEEITASSVMDKFGINEDNAEIIIGKLKPVLDHQF